MKKILVDADALVALAKEDDSNHRKALKIAKSLEKDNLYLTPFTIPEVATVLSYRVSHKSAKAFLKAARKRNLLELSLTSKAKKMADNIFLDQKKKGISWIDCLNIAMIKVHKLNGIFSFDNFYRKMGIKLVKE